LLKNKPSNTAIKLLNNGIWIDSINSELINWFFYPMIVGCRYETTRFI
jgi:hypothetical protein